jgi:hypothetical protein
MICYLYLLKGSAKTIFNRNANSNEERRHSMRKKVLITALSLVLCLSIAFIVTSRASINPEIPNVIAGMWKYTTSNGQVGQIRFDAITAGQVFDPRIGTGTFGAGKWTIGTNRLDSPITFAAGTMPAGSLKARSSGTVINVITPCLMA